MSVPDITGASHADLAQFQVLDESAAAALPLASVASAQFFDIDSTRATMREYSFGTPWPLMPIAMIVKVLGVRVPGSTDDPNVEALWPFEVEALPAEAQERLSPVMNPLQELGFANPIYHRIEDVKSQTSRWLVTLVHRSGRAVARIHERQWLGTRPPRIHRFVDIISGFDDLTFLCTTSAKPDMLGPASIEVQRLVAAAPGELWSAHEQRLRDRSMGAALRPAITVEQGRDLAEDHHAALRDFHLDRGIFKQPATPISLPPAPDVEGMSFDNAAVYHEMVRQRQRQGTWTGMLLVLGISLVVFVAAGFAVWSWDFVLMLVPVLLVHELGHYIAMKCFGYRDLRMFFIPLLGAAVSGRSFNAPGWKHALVALAGPVAGITGGVIAGVAGLVFEQQLLVMFAILSMIVNGFNLLPFLPLDGGRVMQTVIFSRHFWLDALFRLFAVVVLLGLAMGFEDRWLFVIAIVIGISLPLSIRLGRITAQLQREGFGDAINAEGEPSPAYASEVIDRIRRSSRVTPAGKVLAQQSLMVLETVAARPPRWPASIALVGLQGLSMAACALFLVLFMVGRSTDLASFMDIAAATADYVAFEPEELRITRGGDYESSNEPMLTIHAQFEGGVPQTVRDEATASVPAAGAVMFFGESLVVTLPEADDAGRRQWIDRVQGHTRRFSVHLPDSPPGFSLTCIARTDAEAEQLQQELQEFFRAPVAARLIPPWVPSDDRSDTERSAHTAARRTFQRLREVEGTLYEGPATANAQQKIMSASRLGDRRALETAQQEMQNLTQSLRNAAVEKVRSEPGTDGKICELYLDMTGVEFAAVDYGDAAAVEEITRRTEARKDALVAAMGGFDASPEHRPAARSGIQYGGLNNRAGLVLSFHYITFVRPVDGVEALIAWLDRRRCADFKYQWESMYELLDE